jgi:plastocyanin domain-containing protein
MEKGALVLAGLIILGMAGVGALFFFTPSASAASAGSTELVPTKGGVQVVKVTAMSYGYEPSTVRVKKGIPVEFRFKADSSAGCDRIMVIPDFGLDFFSKSGETISKTFTPTQAGEFVFRCAMNMFRGKIIVEN